MLPSIHADLGKVGLRGGEPARTRVVLVFAPEIAWQHGLASGRFHVPANLVQARPAEQRSSSSASNSMGPQRICFDSSHADRWMTANPR
ncbi:hypothetical protein CQ10_38140 [Bradyrhizobium valentinum]|uniref:Uncharacterized protein n=1 Tax=Bradyrhizobium valentinum TaxID=1518501 RepID=A0A0R3LCP8_9BRAD|nr:hypothetical protein CQ10_38140 [Bradyrhizobium valentinum]KRR03285.1 hypothetical protein CP49_15225 [Bradyrhizobium valentinum]